MIRRIAILCLLLLLPARADAAVWNWTNTAQEASTGYQPGDTVNMWGTFTNTLTITNSGTPGSPVTFYFESNAVFIAPTLPANSAWITIDGRSNLVIDGGVNGALQLTSNGTPSSYGWTGVYTNNPVRGIFGASLGVDHVTIQNLSILNLYQRTTNTDLGAEVIATYMIGSDVTYSNLYINASEGGITHEYYTATPSSNVTITRCVISNYNHGVEIGTGNATNPTLLNLIITHNTFQSGDMYETADGIGDLGLHRNAVFIFNESGQGGYPGGYTGCVSNVVIAYNYIQHGTHPLSHTAGSGGIFFDTYDVTEASNVVVFCNVSTTAAPLSYSGGGGCAAASGTGALLANNTVIGWSTNGQNAGGAGGVSIAGSNVWAYNNLVQGQGGGITLVGMIHNTNGIPLAAAGSSLLYPAAEVVLTNSWSDYNVFNYSTADSFYELVEQYQGPIQWQYALADNLAGWMQLLTPWGLTHFDPHSTTNVPVFAAGTFAPATNDTVLVLTGTNLTALLASMGFSNPTDFAGNALPATGKWPIGAYLKQGQAAPAGQRVRWRVP